MDSYRQLKAKIPCKETGIEIKRTLCDICSPGVHCGIDAYVKDGKVIKIEGTKEHPMNKGLLCTKGLCNREYIYREDRIKTPLKRIGKRGEGKFKPISWDEAYREIAEKLNRVKSEYGAKHVAFLRVMESGIDLFCKGLHLHLVHLIMVQNLVHVQHQHRWLEMLLLEETLQCKIWRMQKLI